MTAVSMQRRVLFWVGAVAVVAGCVVSVDPFVPSACQTDADCPPVGGRSFRCVATGQGTAKQCEAQFPYSPPDAGTDGGLTGPGTYCTDIKALMNRYCIACHTASSNASGRSDFFLDSFQDKALSDGGTLRGVSAMRDSIVARMVNQRDQPLQMPPDSFPLQPTPAELEAVSAWHGAGSRYSTSSAGYDASAPCVSYAREIQPIWNAKCVGCHSDFLAEPSQGNLISTEAVCPSPAPERVVPGQPGNSELWRRLVDDAGTRCGSGGKMPQGGPALGAAELELIRSWILEGATNN